MISFGPRETLQIIDGSTDFPIVQTLGTIGDRVGFAAPALAFVADAINSYRGSDRICFENGLEDIFVLSQPKQSPGLEIAPSVYTVLPFGRSEARMFPRIREAVGGEAGTLMLQTLTIAAINDLRLLLEGSKQNELIARELRAAGIHVGIELIA